MKNRFQIVFNEESGQGMVEYALIFALLILVALGGLKGLKDGVFIMYQKISSNLP